MRIWLQVFALLSSMGLGFARPLLAAAGDEAFFAAEVIDAAAVNGTLPLDAAAPAWSKAQPKTLKVHPQRTVKLNDARVNAQLATLGAAAIQVKALHNGHDLALLIAWQAHAKSIPASGPDTDTFGDAVAIETPRRYGPGLRLPYVGMGDEAFPVDIALQRARPDGVQASEFVAAGFGSLTRVKAGRAKMRLTYDERGQSWSGVFILPIVALASKTGLVPLAVAIWNGERGERGGNKMLSGWKFARLAGTKLEDAYVHEAAFGYHPGDLGTAATGKEIFSVKCTPCHQAGEFMVAAAGVAPNLSGIGAIASAAYLRDAITDPNQVVLRNLNQNQHYDKSQARDAHGAYANNLAYRWDVVDASGRRLSKMPNLQLSPTEVKDVVAYLKTLDGTP